MTASLERVGSAIEVKEKDAAPDDLRLWSVTTILSVLDKPGLLYWAAEQAALAAVRMAKSLPTRIEEDGAATVVKTLRDARFQRPKDSLSDSEFGTQCHALAEEYTLTGVRPTPTREVFMDDLDAAVACMDRHDELLQKWDPTFLATEVTLYNETYRYAGQTDGFAAWGGVDVVYDYKFSKKSYNAQGKPTELYPEVAAQLAAYRFAEFAAVWRARRFSKYSKRYYLLNAAEREMALPVPKVEGGLGIKITPEHATAYPVRCDEHVFDCFLYIMECARWMFDVAPGVIGEPLTLPEVAA